jgi:low affinity Fe/Cu permease
MELVAIIIAVMIYQWAIIPYTKKKIGYMRDTTVNPIFYDYKRKWQVYFELGVTLGAILLAVFGAGIIGIYSALFIPFGLASIFLVRGKLEKQTMPEYKHHIISYIHAIAILLAFVAVIIVAIILN